MIRFGFDQFGAPDVFRVVDAPQPTPKPGQVQLKVLGFGLNPYDASLRRGEQAESRPLPMPIVPGTELVGEITALGAAVQGFALGERVINYRPLGGYSDFVTASTNKIARIPATLALDVAAGLSQAGIAAFSLLQALSLRPGQTLAVVGASGAVGALTVQLARAAGLRVIAVASAANRAYLQEVGASVALAYDQGTAWHHYQDTADAAVNAVKDGADNGVALALTKPTGTLVTTAFAAVPKAPKPHVARLQLGSHGLVPAQDAFPTLVKLAEAGQLTLRIARAFPFSLPGVQAGHIALEQHHAAGKLVVMKDL
ncbi:NADP-dependent oxidoreductase [Lacticaseibacillus parakribbianus]|uniref:NADP-dependent oxidoreductase n=1 Tax=Lacticaseibacillus parakribbianus TaxID=2970927 RepID=UPI0021CB825F|nr:NADP-dependent oxidoreductase [Lacticaseibacillus parakribbianus]